MVIRVHMLDDPFLRGVVLGLLFGHLGSVYGGYLSLSIHDSKSVSSSVQGGLPGLFVQKKKKSDFGTNQREWARRSGDGDIE